MTNILTPTDSGNYRHFGLEQIFTNAKVVNELNITAVVIDALTVFNRNKLQITELQEQYKGDQVILYRQPTSNQPVNERVNMNLFPTLATTWVGLILGEKTDYVFNGKEKEKAKREDMNEIIKHVRINHDVLLDKETLFDLFITGIAYQYCGGQKKDGKPALMANIPADSCFTIHSREIGYPTIASVIVGKTAMNKEQLSVYTDTRKFILEQDETTLNTYSIVQNIQHYLPENPIQEIKLNPQLLSMVAQGESVQNALNMAVSESINDTIFQMRSMLFIMGAELTKENMQLAKEFGILNVTTTDGRQVSAEYLTKPLDETINSLRSMLFDVLYFIMGIPSTNGGTSGNTGAAVVASGMQTMDLVAYSIQLEMKKAKTAMLDNLITLLRSNKIITSEISAIDVDIVFDRQLVMDIVGSADAFSKLKVAGFPDRDNLKVTKLSSDVDRVAIEMKKAADEVAQKAKDAILNAVATPTNNSTTTSPPTDPNIAPNPNNVQGGGINA